MREVGQAWEFYISTCESETTHLTAHGVSYDDVVNLLAGSYAAGKGEEEEHVMIRWIRGILFKNRNGK